MRSCKGELAGGTPALPGLFGKEIIQIGRGHGLIEKAESAGLTGFGCRLYEAGDGSTV